MNNVNALYVMEQAIRFVTNVEELELINQQEVVRQYNATFVEVMDRELAQTVKEPEK